MYEDDASHITLFTRSIIGYSSLHVYMFKQTLPSSTHTHTHIHIRLLSFPGIIVVSCLNLSTITQVKFLQFSTRALIESADECSLETKQFHKTVFPWQKRNILKYGCFLWGQHICRTIKTIIFSDLWIICPIFSNLSFQIKTSTHVKHFDTSCRLQISENAEISLF